MLSRAKAPRSASPALVSCRSSLVVAAVSALVAVAAVASLGSARPSKSRSARPARMAAAKATTVLPRLAVAPGDTALRLMLLETTDIHGALLPGATDRDKRAWGSAAVLAAWERMLMARAPGAAVLVDGGDMMQGSPISTVMRGRSVIDFMNEVGYDAAACGNHEFDWSVDTLAARIRQANFPVLACNIFDKATGKQPDWIAPYTLERRGRVTLGIVGAATPETPLVTVPKNVAALRFDDPVTLVNAYADTCRARGADVVIALLHIGGEAIRDNAKPNGPIYELATQLKVDALFGGHTHQFVTTTIAGKPVMIAGSHGRAVAELGLKVNRVARSVQVTQQVLHRTYADSVRVAPTDKVAKIVDGYNSKVAPIMGRPLGTASGAYLREQPSMGNFVADVMKAATRSQVAFTNSGGLRADLDSGTVTLGELYEIMPFDNALVTCKLTGAQLKRVLEEQPSKIFFAGLRARYDAARPDGDHAVQLTLDDGTPVDSTALYSVVVNDFMWQGGDGFKTFAQGADIVQTGKLIRDAMVDFVSDAGKAGTAIAPDRTSRFADRPGRSR